MDLKCAAKRLHAATTDKTEHAFAATAICAYRPNVICGEDFEPPEVTSKGKMLDKDLGGTKDRHSDGDSSLHVDGPDTSISASPQPPDIIATSRRYYPH